MEYGPVPLTDKCVSYCPSRGPMGYHGFPMGLWDIPWDFLLSSLTHAPTIHSIPQSHISIVVMNTWS